MCGGFFSSRFKTPWMSSDEGVSGESGWCCLLVKPVRSLDPFGGYGYYIAVRDFVQSPCPEER